MHLVTEQPMVLRRVCVGVEKICRPRSQRAVRIALDSADAQQRCAECMPYADLRLVFPVGFDGSSVNTYGQRSLLLEFGVRFHVFIGRVHVLNAGYAERRGMLQRLTDSAHTVR